MSTYPILPDTAPCWEHWVDVTFQEEAFSVVWPELECHLQAHWQEIGQDQEHMPLDVDTEVYLFMEREGKLSVVTMRADGELVGYVITLLHTSLHSRQVLTGYLDVYYVHPEYRRGWGPVQLLRQAETSLRRRGAQRLVGGHTVERDVGVLFRRCHWRPAELFYSKWIGA